MPGPERPDPPSELDSTDEENPRPDEKQARPDDVDPAALKRIRQLAVLSAAAAVLAVPLAPIGLALGVLTIVLVVRHRRLIGRTSLGRVAVSIPLAGGIFALVIGALISTALLLASDELMALRDCAATANTHLAQDRCEATYGPPLSERLAFLSWLPGL